MTIIDYAAGDPAPDPKAIKVTYYYGKDGKLAVKGQHVKEAEAYVVKEEFNKQVANELQIGKLKQQIASAQTSPLRERQKIADLLKNNDGANLADVKKLFEQRGIPRWVLSNALETQHLSDDGLKISDLNVDIDKLADATEKNIQKEIDALQSQVQLLEQQAGEIPALAAPSNFGEPAGANQYYQNDLLRTKQLLNTVPGL